MEIKRRDGRAPSELRPISFERGIAPNSAGSVLVKFGNTQVICAVTLEKRVPGWMIRQGVSGGWITAEYSLLPYSTFGERKSREISKGKQDGRTVEIQRLIGRAVRAVLDLDKMPGYTLWIDCDVLQADGGTRTAAISGAYVAAKIAIDRLLKLRELKADPFTDSLAAVSVGISNNIPLLDLNAIEDQDASVDFNVVMTGSGKYVELQGSGEQSTFDDSQLAQMLSIAKGGILTITEKQNAVLG
jgi:ribonuclease PH